MSEKNYNDSIYPFYKFSADLSVLEIKVTISPVSDIFINGWIGAAIRNNLLYAAEHTNVIGAISLLQIINTLTIKQHHPLYKEMEGGFPRGFSLSLHSHQTVTSSVRLEKDEPLSFSILVYGHFADYTDAFLSAIQKMCERGFGTPMASFRIDQCIHRNTPLRLADCMNEKFDADNNRITLRYNVPVNLFNNTKRSRNASGIIERQNEFPGFYQLIRAAAYRICKLTALYTCPNATDFYPSAEASIEPFIQYAASLMLESAHLQRVELTSTPKKGQAERISLSGYTGEMSYQGYFNYYVPLLMFGQYTGVGSGTSFATGYYSIERN